MGENMGVNNNRISFNDLNDKQRQEIQEILFKRAVLSNKEQETLLKMMLLSYYFYQNMLKSKTKKDKEFAMRFIAEYEMLINYICDLTFDKFKYREFIGKFIENTFKSDFDIKESENIGYGK